MQMQEMEITIGTDGNVIVHVTGIPGQDCVALTDALEQAVGTVENRTFTPEYYEQPVVEQTDLHTGQR
jgi:Protein of unknown function (DUF2997)